MRSAKESLGSEDRLDMLGQRTGTYDDGFDGAEGDAAALRVELKI